MASGAIVAKSAAYKQWEKQQYMVADDIAYIDATFNRIDKEEIKGLHR